MSRRVSRTFQVRRAMLRHLASRYQQASRTQKTLLLDSFVEWTGYTRKYAIELLNHGEHDQQTIQRRRLPQYSPAVQQGPLSSLEGDTLRVRQTAPIIPAQPGGVVGGAGTFATHGGRTPPVARHECLHGRALLAYTTQTPPTWPARHCTRSVA